MKKLIEQIKSKLQEAKGFTLVELAVVMVVLAVLVAILVPQFTGYKKEAENSTNAANLRTLQTAVAAYLANNDIDDLKGTSAGTGKWKINQAKLVEKKLIPSEITVDASVYITEDGIIGQ